MMPAQFAGYVDAQPRAASIVFLVRRIVVLPRCAMYRVLRITVRGVAGGATPVPALRRTAL